MSYWKDERDVDKHLWELPIPLFDPSDPAHQRLAELGAQEADLVATLDLDETKNFVTLRRQVGTALVTRCGSLFGGGAGLIEDLLHEWAGPDAFKSRSGP